MPYKKKAPARQKKFIGGALSAVAGRKKRKPQKGKLANLVSPAMRKKAAATMKARKATQAKNMAGLSADQRNLLGQAQAHAFKSGKGTKAIAEMTKKYGMTKAGVAAGKAAGVKARMAAEAKKLIGGKANPLKGKKPTGRIFSTVTGSRKAKELARKRRTGGVAMSRAAREAMKKRQMERMRGRSGTRIKPPAGRGRVSRPAVMPRKGTAAYNQMMARRRAAARRAAAARRRGRPTTPRRGRPTTPRTRRGRPTTPRTRRGRPVSPRTRRAPTRRGRPVARGRRGLGRVLRTARKALR
jgi:hypothetical protein